MDTGRNRFVRGALASLESSVITLLCRTDLPVGTAVTELGNLNMRGVIHPWGDRGQVAALNCQRQGGHDYRNGQQSQSSNQNSLTCADQRLVDDDIPGSEIDRKPVKLLLYL